MFFIIFVDPLIVASLEDMRPSNNWRYEKSSRYLFTPKHETLYGLHMATSKPSAKDISTYNSINEIKDQWNRNKLEVTDRICFNAKVSTLGRVIISDILGIDIDEVIGENNAIDDSNIGKLIALLGSKSDRSQRLLRLQNFGDKIATTEGLPAVPFSEIYTVNREKIKSILKSNESDEVKEIKLNEHIRETMEDTINNLPNGVKSLFKGSSRVKPSQIKDIWTPAVKVNGDVYDSSTIFSGLNETAYTDIAATNRTILSYKQAFVPIAGYNMRQLADAEMNIMYDENGKSPDKLGIILDRESALNRTDLNGNIITGNGNPNELVRVKSCINNNKNLIYKDELGTEMTPNKGSAIGISFATSLAERAYQEALGLKHGGDLHVIENASINAVEAGKVTELTATHITILGSHEYTYILSKFSAILNNVTEGAYVIKGQILAKSTKVLYADNKIARFNTLVGTHVAGEYAKAFEHTLNFAPISGIIRYQMNTNTVIIGNISMNMNNNEMYFLPNGYEVKAGDNICTGVLDTNQFNEICPDVGLTYYCFYRSMKMALNANDLNSEIVESLFKCIRPYKFSVENVNRNNPDIIQRLHYGDTKRAMLNAVADASNKAIEENSNDPRINFEYNLITKIIMSV